MAHKKGKIKMLKEQSRNITEAVLLMNDPPAGLSAADRKAQVRKLLGAPDKEETNA